MNLKKIGATVATTALLGLGLAVIPAVGASAHTFGVTATCEDGLTINLSNYHPTIPGEDAVPGTPAVYGPGSDETVHHDAVGTPTITIDNPDYKPAVPGVDAVPPTYVQEYEFVQHITHKTRWETNPNWNAGPNGKGWSATGNHRDTSTILTPGVPAVPAQPEVGTPTIEVDNPAYVAPYDEVVHHDGELITPAVPGKDAVPEQHNHVTITEDGNTLVDSDFGPSFHENYPNTDKTVAHDYHVVVTSLDGIGAFTKDLHIDACETPVTPVEGTPTITVTPPTCDNPFNTISYDIPEGLSINGFTGSGSIKAEDYPGSFEYGVPSVQNVTVDEGYSYEGPSTVTFTVTAPPSDADCAGPQPDAKVVYGDWETGEYGCGDTTVTMTRTVTVTPYILEGRTWVLDEENAEVSSQTETRNLTGAEIEALHCPVVPPTKPPVVTKPQPILTLPVVPAAAPEAVAPILLSGDDTLAHTGANTDFREVGLAGGLVLLGLLSVGVAYGIRHRKDKVEVTESE